MVKMFIKHWLLLPYRTYKHLEKVTSLTNKELTLSRQSLFLFAYNQVATILAPIRKYYSLIIGKENRRYNKTLKFEEIPLRSKKLMSLNYKKYLKSLEEKFAPRSPTWTFINQFYGWLDCQGLWAMTGMHVLYSNPAETFHA